MRSRACAASRACTDSRAGAQHGHDAFHDASEAYKVLSDPIQRKAYDDKAGIHRDPDGSHQPHVFTDTSSYETVTHSPMAPWMVGQSSLTPEQQYFVARDQMKLRSERPGNAFNNNVRVKSFVAAKEARRQARSGVALWLLAPFVAAGLWVAAMRSQPA